MMEKIEPLRAAFVEDAGAIHQRIIAGEKVGQQRRVADRQVDDRDLADIAHRLEEFGLLGVAAADDDDIALRRQTLDDVAADEARSAEHRGAAISHALSRGAAPCRPCRASLSIFPPRLSKSWGLGQH